MSQQMKSDLLKLSLYNTYDQLTASCDYQIYLLEEFKWMSIHVKAPKRKSVTFLIFFFFFFFFFLSLKNKQKHHNNKNKNKKKKKNEKNA